MMKVFISWSGPTSHQVALVFRDWFIETACIMSRATG